MENKMEYIIRVYTVGGKFLGEEKLYSDLDEIEKIIMSYIKVGNIGSQLCEGKALEVEIFNKK